MASKWKIPTWEDAINRISHNTGDALDRFVYENEPTNPDQELTFRTQLQELVDFILGEVE